jgi:hypothetical protein
MKNILLSEKDVRSLNGKWILQVNIDNPDYTITEENWAFVSEKRLSLVTGLRMTGLWYDHGDFKTWEEFAFRFNHYLEGESKDKRFHRLLTNKEIDFVCKKFKETT